MVSQADKSEHAKIKHQLRYQHRKLPNMDEELARDGIAIRPNEKGQTALWVFDTKAGRWTPPPDDFDVDVWRKNWRKRRLGTPKVPPPPDIDWINLGLPDFTSESPAVPADNPPKC